MYENVYYSPEKFGLTLIAEHDLAEAFYSYDMLAVWQDVNGYYLATDSGCSCPTPFEDYKSVAMLTGPLTKLQAIEESQNLKATNYDPIYDLADFAKFIEAITNSEESK